MKRFNDLSVNVELTIDPDKWNPKEECEIEVDITAETHTGQHTATHEILLIRAAGESKKLDNMKVDIADLKGDLEIAIQCKHTQNLPNYFKLSESCPDPRPFCLLWKKVAELGSISEGSVAVIPLDFFYKLLEIYHRQS